MSGTSEKVFALKVVQAPHTVSMEGHIIHLESIYLESKLDLPRKDLPRKYLSRKQT